MNAYYKWIRTQFETRIADLRPAEAYADLQDVALELTQYGFVSIPAQFSIVVARDQPLRRSAPLLESLTRAYGFYAHGELKEALGIAERVGKSAKAEADRMALIDALHLEGRIRYDEESFSEAMDCFDEEMNQSQHAGCVPGFVRAIHETSRVLCGLYDPLPAEFGFRFALNYYTASSFQSGEPKESDVPGSDWQNILAAVRCLRSTAELYGLMEDGPTEADAAIERLASSYFSNRDQSGALFFEIRRLATKCLATIPDHKSILDHMEKRAASMSKQIPKLGASLMEEARFIRDFAGRG